MESSQVESRLVIKMLQMQAHLFCLSPLSHCMSHVERIEAEDLPQQYLERVRSESVSVQVPEGSVENIST
jgi:hypothetical protein